MLKLAASFLLFFALLYAGACAYLFVNQRAFLYLPTAETRIPGVQSLNLATAGASLKIWRIGSGEPAVIYFGGNAEDVAFNIPQFTEFFRERSVYLVNYRGYGGSTGKPTEAHLFADALAVYDAVRAQHQSISVIGRSLGSGVAVYLASVRPVAKLVLITPYDSILNIARRNFPTFPVSLLLQDKFESAARAGAISAPTLVMLAHHDEVIPRANSEALIAALSQAPVKVEVISNSDHNSISADGRYWKRVQEFL
jgi:pimeloyl-ACP methyl ester carboxylesterase